MRVGHLACSMVKHVGSVPPVSMAQDTCLVSVVSLTNNVIKPNWSRRLCNNYLVSP